jgi:hypothetical protein
VIFRKQFKSAVIALVLPMFLCIFLRSPAQKDTQKKKSTALPKAKDATA